METERLSNLDEYGNRKFVVPAEVRGKFRRRREQVYFVLLIIFVALPWVRINGLQGVMLDVAHRRFEIFGQLFLAHDAPLIFLILAALAMMLAFVTAVWGRIWCGWACPQTVFIEGLYRKIEIWIQGDYIQRRKLLNGGLTFRRVYLGLIKWFLFFVVSSAIAHSFVAYFTGSHQLLEMMKRSPQDNWTYFLLVSSMTGLLMFNFGWFREQFCTIMCPYGRFQSVLMDDRSLAVLYDVKRGEPRKGALPADTPRGDCVSCRRCVEVCPVGIDIRNGLQMDCIACTACIDACDEIMAKVNKPAGLIRYQSVSGKKAKVWRPRTAVYFAVVTLCLSGLALDFSSHTPFAVDIVRGKDLPFQTLPNGLILNHVKAHIFNQTHEAQSFKIRISDEDAARGLSLTISTARIELKSGESSETHFFVIFPKGILNEKGTGEAAVIVTDEKSGHSTREKVTAIGPI